MLKTRLERERLMIENSTVSMKKSYFNAVFSMLIFSTIGLFRRFIPLPSGILALSRGILGGIFLFVLLKIKRKGKVRPGTKNTVLLILTGAFIGLNWVLLFESYNYTTIPVATLAYYMEPSIVILLSPVFFNEKLTGKKLLCVLCSVAGMVLVSGIADGTRLTSSDVSGILYGLGAAALYASVIILNKKISGVDIYYKTMVELFAAAITIVPYILLKEDISSISMTLSSILMLLVVGVVHTGFAYSLYFGSMEKLSAQSLALISYIDPVAALILSGIVLGETMSIWGVTGALMIIVSSLLSELTSEKAEG